MILLNSLALSTSVSMVVDFSYPAKYCFIPILHICAVLSQKVLSQKLGCELGKTGELGLISAQIKVLGKARTATPTKY